MNRLLDIAVMAGVLAAPGCVAPGEWQKSESFHAIWSDDGAELAVIRNTRELRDEPMLFEGTHMGVRNLRVEVALADANGADRRALLSERPGRVYSLYYMRSAGYALVEHSDEGDRRVWLSYLDGSHVDVTPAPLTIVPSPDGRMLLMVDYCLDLDRNLLKCHAGLSFVDTATLSPRSGPFPLEFTRAPGGYRLLAAWTPEGSAIVWSPDTGEAFEFRQDGAVSEVGPPDCVDGFTSSGRFSADGREAIVQGWDPLSFEMVDTGTPGFPERCAPR